MPTVATQIATELRVIAGEAERGVAELQAGKSAGSFATKLVTTPWSTQEGQAEANATAGALNVASSSLQGGDRAGAEAGIKTALLRVAALRAKADCVEQGGAWDKQTCALKSIQPQLQDAAGAVKNWQAEQEAKRAAGCNVANPLNAVQLLTQAGRDQFMGSCGAEYVAFLAKLKVVGGIAAAVLAYKAYRWVAR